MIDLSAITVAALDKDPYPIYRDLRLHAPVAYVPALDVWMVTLWNDVVAGCQSPDTFPATVANSPTDRALGGISMMTTDGEPAKQRRRPFDPSLKPRAIEATMPDVFDRLCAERLDRLAKNGGGDLVVEYFEPVALMSLAHVIGIADFVDVPTLRRWYGGLAAGVSNYEDDPAKTEQCAVVSSEIDDTINPLFEKVMERPDDTMLSHLLQGTSGALEDRISWGMPSLKLVLLGGLQEPAHGGATIADCLLAHPDQLGAVRSDPSLVAAAVEEGLRWTAPIGNLLRSSTGEHVLSGVRIPAGERLILVVASANRDEDIWGPTADQFDIFRPKRAHLSFATGPHYCIGHHFARAQLKTAISMLVERFPNLRHANGAPTTYRGHEYRSPTSIEVEV